MIAYFNTTTPAAVRSMKPRLSLWHTFWQRMIQDQEQPIQKNVARYIALNGGRLTDAAEREMFRRVLR